MKYLKKFKTIQDFEAFAQSSDYTLPNITLIVTEATDDKSVIFNPLLYKAFKLTDGIFSVTEGQFYVVDKNK